MLALLISTPMSGDDVVALQEQLLELGYDTGRPSGVFDEQTERGLRAFQRDYCDISDGVCGPSTLRALRQLGARRVKGGRPHLLREQELLRQAGPRLRGKRIVIDPGHGGPDRGVAVAGVTEADLMWDLARRLEGRMAATGMEALLTRREDTCPTEARSGRRSPTPPARTSCCRCTSTRTAACTPRGWRPSTSATARASRRRWARRSPATSTAS